MARDESVELRPGVLMPDWSAVEGTPARAALAAIFRILRKAVSDLDATEDRVWRAVQQVFAQTAMVPTVGNAAAAAGLDRDPVLATLRRLQARDLVVFDEAAGVVAGAYPFTMAATGHCVTFAGRTRSAMCAIDALGIGAMCGTDSVIASACAACGTAIEIATAGHGRALATVSPGAAVAHADTGYSGNCAATSLCRSTLFFCSAAHRDAWRHKVAKDGGFGLSMREAMAVGVALFGPILADARKDGG